VVVVVQFLGEEMGKSIASNKKAFHDYEILDKFEAGIVLAGSEVKALRAARVNLKDSYVRIIKNEAFLLNAHISYISTTNPHYKPDERRSRKLLLHRAQIDKLIAKSTQKGLSIVPLSLFFNHKNFAKVQIALAKGKKEYDKRNSLKTKDAARETARAVKEFSQR